MKRKIGQNVLLLLLALVFSAGLMYAFIALPQWLDGVMQRTVSGIGHDPGFMPERPDLFIQAYRLKLVGSISLIIIALLIVIGLLTRKTGFAWVGAIALFLPVFGTFALSMFYLAGLGIFNTILLPFMDWDMAILNLGDVVLIPYKILMWFFDLFGWHAHNFIMYFCMGTGAFLFVFSVFTWLQTYYSQQKVAKSWLYKFSRHPQYLGWMIWSYGLMLFGPTLNNMKKSWGWNGTLAWLLSSMVIIGICMLEELRMREKAGEEYDYYRDKTSFLFPLPRLFKQLIKLPGKLIVKDKYPSKSRQIVLIVFLYTVVLMGLSLFWADFKTPGSVIAEQQKVSFTKQKADSLMEIILKSQDRRALYGPTKELAAMGPASIPYLNKLVHRDNSDLREFALNEIKEHEFTELQEEVFDCLTDSVYRVRRSATQALEIFKPTAFKDTLLFMLQSGYYPEAEAQFLSVLTALQAKEVVPFYLQQMHHKDWWVRTEALKSIYSVDPDNSWSTIYAALKDAEDPVKTEALWIILNDPQPGADEFVRPMLKDPSWEVRFLAREVLKKL